MTSSQRIRRVSSLHNLPIPLVDPLDCPHSSVSNSAISQWIHFTIHPSPCPSTHLLLAFSQVGMRVGRVPGLMSSLYVAAYQDGRRLLLDSGCRADFPLIQSHLKGEASHLSLCMVSHAHPDHSGGAKSWQEAGVPVAAPRGINLWYRGWRGGLQRRIDVGLARLVINLSRPASTCTPSLSHQSPIPMTPSIPSSPTLTSASPPASFVLASLAAAREAILPSDDLAMPEHIPFDLEITEEGPIHSLFPDWLAMWTPGHTSHMLSFYHPAEQVLYAADCLIHIGGRFRLPLVVDFPSVQAATLRRLAALPLRRLLLAHGGDFSSEHYDFNSELLHLAEEAKRLESEGPPGDLRWRMMRPFVYVETREIMDGRRRLEKVGSVLPP